MVSLEKDGPLDAVLSSAVDAIIVIDQRGIIQRVSDSVVRLFEYQPEECIGKNISLLMPEPDRSAHDSYIDNYLSGGTQKIIGIGRKTTARKQSGATFPIHLSVGQFEHRGGKYFVGICHDLTEYTEALAKLREAERRYRDIVESQKHYICRIDRTLRVTFANVSLLKALDMSDGEVIGTPLSSIITEEAQCLSGALNPLFSDNSIDEITVKVSMKSKDAWILAEWTFRKTTPGDGSDEVQGVGIDISEKEEAIQRAEYLRDHDQLTGLLNTRSLMSSLVQAAEPGQLYAMLYLDITRFSQINQRYGHAVGDRVFVDLSRRIRKFLPPKALVARPGGDKFIIASHVEDHADAALMAKGVIDALAEPYRLEGTTHVLSGKVGVALFPPDHPDISRLPDLAEAALRDAKANNESVVFFSEQSHEQLLREIIVEQGLKEAVVDESIEIYLQPKLSLADRRTRSYEALARWKHKHLGQVSPAEFISVAEKSGLGPTLDQYIIKQVAVLITRIAETGETCLPIAINITANHFSDESLFTHVAKTLDEFDLPPSAIELEITETAILNFSTAVSANLARLRKLGMRISIDDFGTGYSSLSYLKKLDVDELKIDKSFIDDIEDPKGRQLVQAVVGLAHAFGLSVTAEGIETKAQAELLVKMGCDLGQGYYFSRPLPPEEAIKRRSADLRESKR